MLSYKKYLLLLFFFHFNCTIFIKDEINFTDIFSIVENVTKLSEPGDPKSIEDVFEYDKLARKYALNEVIKFSNDR